MITNTILTIYHFADDAYRRITTRGLYTETGTAAFEKTGLTAAHKATVYVPFSEQISITPGKDFLVNGMCELDLDTTTQRTLSAGIAQLMAAGGVTIMAADCKQYGSAHMWHYKLLCR